MQQPTAMRTDRRDARPWFVPLLFLPMLLAACASPAYYSQAVSGHFELMRLREPIEELLASPDTSPELKQRLSLAQDIRTFGIDDIGLSADAGYTQFAKTGREAVSWNVVAAPEFSLEPKTWCFAVAGCVPYRGYFKKEGATRFAGKLHDKGYDVSVTPATAYSTLGWFDDPLLDTMLANDDAELAAFLFHEMAHQYLYVKGDTLFNESFASFVEEAGVQLWLESLGAGASLEPWETSRQVAQAFQVLLLSFRADLEQLYASERPEHEMRTEKSRLFTQLEHAWAAQLDEQWNGASYYAAWFDSEPNNARLALVQSYRGGTCAFQNLFREAGRDMPRFLNAASDKAKMDRKDRSDWLKQPCKPIAPESKL